MGQKSQKQQKTSPGLFFQVSFFWEKNEVPPWVIPLILVIDQLGTMEMCDELTQDEGAPLPFETWGHV